MSALLDLQRRFRAALLGRGGAKLPEVADGAIGAAARISVYRNNVIGNLTGALRLTFPAVERLVGAEFFAAAAARFITAAPPRSADLYEYGEVFPEFLAGFEPAQSLAYLPDVARLEWAVNRALHAAMVPALASEALKDVPAEEEAGLCFIAHPSLSLLQLAHQAHAIWEAVLTEDANERDARLGAIDLAAGGEALAVLRGADGLEVIHLSGAGLALARALIKGQTLAEALILVAPEEVAPLLGGFLAQGFFSRWQFLPAAIHLRKG